MRTRSAVLCVLVALTVVACKEEEDDNSSPLPTSPVTDPTTPPPDPNAAPVISGDPSLTATAGDTYIFIPVATDADNDPLAFEISGLPGWATFNSTTGELRGTPGDSNVGETGDIEIRVTDGKKKDSIGPFQISINGRSQGPVPANSAPTISGTPKATVVAGTAYTFTPTASDAENDRLRFAIANRPSWSSFSTSTGRLSGTPTATQTGTTTNIRISVSDGKATTTLPSFSIKVEPPPNRPPTITGTPPTTGKVSTAYSFQPTASDPDGNRLTYSIANKPDWASFSTSSGRLSGTPATNDTGVDSDIRISVSDGTASAALPAFAIEVEAGPNRPPTISGSPSTTLPAGTMYSFQPAANDPDGDSLSWSITNKPSWATFNLTNGSLSGTPSAAGSFAGIQISVTDGKSNPVSLPAFTITASSNAPPVIGSATLTWGSPTENTDGSALTNLAGFRIYYGTSAGSLTRSVQLANPSLTSYVVENLSAGTWYFSVRAYNSSGAESAASNVGSKTIQ